MERQAPNVGRMKLLGATVVPVTNRRPDAARRHRRGVPRLGRESRSTRSTCIGSAVGPHPYPYLVRELQSVIGTRGARADARAQRAACPTRSSPASAAARTPSACSIRSSATQSCEIIGIEAGGTRQRARRERRDARVRPARRAARRVFAAAAGRGRPDPGDALGLRGPRLSGRRPRAFAAAVGRARALRSRDATTSRSRRSTECCRSRGHPARHRIRARARGREALGAAQSRASKCSSASPAAATRTCRRCSAPCWLKRRSDHEAAAKESARRSAARARRHAASSRSSPRAIRTARSSREHLTRDRQRGRRGRDRRAVHRPDGRRHDHPALEPRGAARRASRCAGCSRRCTRMQRTPIARAPLVLMSYLNPLLAFGFDGAGARAAQAGVCGFIVPDLPYDESADFRAALARHGLALIQMVTPVTPPGAPGEAVRGDAGLRLRRDDDRHHRAHGCRARRCHALSRCGARRLEACPCAPASASAGASRWSS